MIYTRHQTGSKRKHAWIYRSRRWLALRAKLFRERGEQCESCYSIGEVQVHHIKPVSLGGAKFDESNLEVLCRSCHLERHRKIEAEKMPAWQRRLYELVDRPVVPQPRRIDLTRAKPAQSLAPGGH